MFIIYEPLILRFGFPSATTLFPTLFASEPLVIIAVSTPIQIFFAWRIRMLTRNDWIPALIVLLSIISLAGGIWTGILIIQVRLFVRKPELHTPALVWFLASCIADVVITVFLVISLSRRRTGFTHTDDVISKLIRMAVQTGMLTAFFAIGDVVFFMTLEHTTLNFVWDLALSKLYSNCLLSTLNARASLKDMVSGQRNAVLSITTDRQHTSFYIPNSPATEDSAYELETPKSFGAPSLGCQQGGGYGIMVTKIVERLEDPISTPVNVFGIV